MFATQINRVLPLVITIGLVLSAAIWVLHSLPIGDRLQYDEYYTLERSFGFIKHDDWLNVYTRGKPSANKPPLQYWLTAVTAQVGVPDLLAMRFWPFVFFIALLIATAVTSVTLAKGNWWAAPASVLLLGSSMTMVELSRSGLLDMGVGMFLMLAISSMALAKSDTRAWIACGVFLGLGAMQKAPIILLLGIMLWVLHLRKDPDYQWRHLRQIPHFNYGYRIAIGLTLFWPLLQMFQHGVKFMGGSLNREIVKRLNPLREFEGNSNNMGTALTWLWDDWYVFAAVALGCMLAVLLLKRWRSEAVLFSMSFYLVALLLILTFAKGSIYPRYLSLITPFLVVIVVKVFSDVIKWKPAVLMLGVLWFGVSFEQVDKIIHEDYSNSSRLPWETVQQVVTRAEELVRPNDLVVANREDPPTGAYGYFGQSIQPDEYFHSSKSGSIKRLKATIEEYHFEHKGNVDSGIFGIALAENLPNIEKKFPGLQTLAAVDGIVFWRFPARVSDTASLHANGG